MSHHPSTPSSRRTCEAPTRQRTSTSNTNLTHYSYIPNNSHTHRSSQTSSHTPDSGYVHTIRPHSQSIAYAADEDMHRTPSVHSKSSNPHPHSSRAPASVRHSSARRPSATSTYTIIQPSTRTQDHQRDPSIRNSQPEHQYQDQYPTPPPASSYHPSRPSSRASTRAPPSPTLTVRTSASAYTSVSHPSSSCARPAAQNLDASSGYVRVSTRSKQRAFVRPRNPASKRPPEVGMSGYRNYGFDERAGKWKEF